MIWSKNFTRTALALGIASLFAAAAHADEPMLPPPPNVYVITEGTAQLSQNVQIETIENETAANNEMNQQQQQESQDQATKINQAVQQVAHQMDKGTTCSGVLGGGWVCPEHNAITPITDPNRPDQARLAKDAVEHAAENIQPENSTHHSR